MKKSIFIFIALFATTLLLAQEVKTEQKKPLDHSVYDAWKNVGAFSMSNDGKYASYLVQEQEGDRYAEVLNLKTLERNTVERTVQPKLTPDGRFLVAKIGRAHV